MGMAGNIGGSIVGNASSVNMAQMQMNQQAQNNMNQMNMGMGQMNQSNMGVQPQPQQAAGWTCSCGQVNTGNFCSNCGKPRA